MATNAPVSGTGSAPQSADAPKRKRKAQGPRQARPLNILMSVDEAGKPVILTASYNAQDTLTAYVEANDAGKKVNLVTWQAPAKDAAKTA